MLDYMRKNQSSMVIRVVFGVLTLVMIGFGVQYAGVAGNPTETVAEVNQEPIYRQQLQRSVSRMAQAYRGQGLPPEMLEALKVKDMALDDLVRISLMRQEAERMRLSVTDEEVRDAIAQVPAFQDNGHFSFERYDRVLRSNAFSPSDFEEGQREDLLVRKLQEILLSGVYVSDAELRQKFEYDNEQVTLRFVQIRAADSEPGIQVSDEQAQKFYDENKDRFREPERVRAELATYTLSAFGEKVTVEDAEVQSYYDANAADFENKTLDEVRTDVVAALRASKGLQESRRVAAADLEKVKGGASLDSLAQAGVTYGSVGPISRTDPIPGAGRVPELVRELFGTEAGQAGVVETEGNTYIVRVTEKLPPRVPELAEIRDRIVADARRDLASKKAAERANGILVKLREGGDLAAVAGAEGLEVKETESFRRLDSLIPGLGAQADLRTEAFKLTPAKPLAPQVYDVEGDAVIAVLKARLPADEATFADQKETIRTQLIDARKRLVMDEYLKGLKSQAAIRINPDGLARVYLN